MRTIKHYDLPYILGDKVILSMPEFAKVVDIQDIEGTISLWAEVETDNEEVDRVFRIFKTHEDIGYEDYLYYLRSIKIGITVYHIYEKIRNLPKSYNIIDPAFRGEIEECKWCGDRNAERCTCCSNHIMPNSTATECDKCHKSL